MTCFDSDLAFPDRMEGHEQPLTWPFLDGKSPFDWTGATAMFFLVDTSTEMEVASGACDVPTSDGKLTYSDPVTLGALVAGDYIGYYHATLADNTEYYVPATGILLTVVARPPIP